MRVWHYHLPPLLSLSLFLVCVCTHAFTCMHTYTYMHTNTYIPHIHIHTRKYMRTYTRIPKHIYTHMARRETGEAKHQYLNLTL